MSTQPPSFEDPSLKAAIRGAAGGHRASMTLRDKIASGMAAEKVAAPIGSEARPVLVGAKRWLAMAAAIVVGVGVSIGAYEWYTTTGYALFQKTPVPAPTIWQAMVKVHEGGCTETGSNVEAPLADVKAVAAEATTKLNRRVPAPDLSAAGWKLDAATYCTIAGHSTIRFHFVNGRRAVTVISLPQAAWGYQYGSDAYTTSVDDYQIAGFVKDGGLQCVVGDRLMPLADVQKLVDQLRTQ